MSCGRPANKLPIVVLDKAPLNFELIDIGNDLMLCGALHKRDGTPKTGQYMTRLAKRIHAVAAKLETIAGLIGAPTFKGNMGNVKTEDPT